MTPEPINKSLTIEQALILWEEELEKAEIINEEQKENEVRDEVHPIFKDIFEKFNF